MQPMFGIFDEPALDVFLALEQLVWIKLLELSQHNAVFHQDQILRLDLLSGDGLRRLHGRGIRIGVFLFRALPMFPSCQCQLHPIHFRIALKLITKPVGLIRLFVV